MQARGGGDVYGLKNVRSRRDDSLSRVGWDRLEVLLADYYRGQGWQVEHVGTGSSGARFDGGIDLKLRRSGEYVVVQCKHWNAKQVPHNAVHELLGIMVNEGATGAILATSGEFTRYARESAARGGHVQLIDGDALRAMLGPLPELQTAAPNTSSAGASIAAHVGSRLLSATEDRIRYGGALRRGRSRKASDSFDRMLLRLALFLIFAWFMVVVLGGALMRTLGALGTPAHTSTNATSPARATPSPRMVPQPINGQTDIASQRNTTPSPPHQPTAAEIREARRQADEAAAILAPNTPEM